LTELSAFKCFKLASPNPETYSLEPLSNREGRKESDKHFFSFRTF
jgi:hypothetical protein